MKIEHTAFVPIRTVSGRRRRHGDAGVLLLTLHIAFVAADVRAERALLIAAGATTAGEVQETDSGDVMAMLRDPWGLALQLAQRRVTMISG